MQPDLCFTQTGQEERANAASHALGGLLALLALPTLAQPVAADAQALHRAGVQVFVASMVLMYLVSALYHAAPVGAAKRLLRRCDHALIFVFIAGSFTPFALAVRPPTGGLGMLAAVWGVALAGVVLKLAGGLGQRRLSTLLYLAFGWLVAAVALPTLVLLPRPGLQLLVAGGLAYSVGSVFYLLDRRMAYSHLVWHLFVITGSACHALALQQLH